jgi:DNA polymerase III delta subunit
MVNPPAGAAGEPAACFLFYGEEVFPAYLFLDKLRGAQAAQEASPVERFDLAVQSWGEILDSARSASLFMSEQRILLVENPVRKKDNIPTSHTKLSEPDKKLLKAYLEDPPPGTILVVIYPGKIRSSSALVKFFSGFPPSSVQVKELKPLRFGRLTSWIESRFRERGKMAAPDVGERLVELAGNDLRRLDKEVEKISTFTGEDRQRVQVEDVDQVSGWVKSYVEWELSEHLERADFRQCVLILHKLLGQDGIPPVRILGLVSGFFRDILLAKLRLQDGQMDRRSIFKEIKPQIKESFGDLYDRQFRQLFMLAEGISWENLQSTLDKLRDLDLKLKTTTLVFQTLMEGFLFEYCWMRRYGRS